VKESNPFFFLIDARATLLDDSRHTVDYDVDPASESKEAALGFRWFVGGRGIVHVGVTARRDRKEFTTDYSAWALGYTHYDLFGTGAFATVNIRLPFDSPAEGLISPQLVVGVPLTTNQTLTLDFEDTHFRKDTRQFRGVAYDRQDDLDVQHDKRTVPPHARNDRACRAGADDARPCLAPARASRFGSAG
jgi:hypothetical protein